jgi:ech hydrogenase subunit C
MPFLKRSPWIFHYDGSSCNGCDIEVLACLTPMYDVERFGVINTGNPKHADILLITGSINTRNRDVVKALHRQMGDPKVVIAVGTCATSGHFFAECYNTLGGVDSTLPVDLYLPGCAVRPEAIIDAVVQALGILEAKQKRRKAGTGRDAHV